VSRRDSRGNVVPTNHVDFCPCGCKYWTDDGRCIDCGDAFLPEPDDLDYWVGDKD